MTGPQRPEGRERTTADRLYDDLAFAAPELWRFHIERRIAEAEAEARQQAEAKYVAEIDYLRERNAEARQQGREREPTIAQLAEVIHDAGPYEADGGVPDVCNRWPEHERLARHILDRWPRAALASEPDGGAE